MSSPQCDTTGSDLDWQALCFLWEELPPGEAEEFTKRLATDPAARAAVDRASLLLETWAAPASVLDRVIPASRSQPVAGQRVVSVKRFFAVLGSVAAAAIAGLVLRMESLPDFSAQPAREAGQLVALWRAAADPVPLESPLEESEPSPLLPPDWLIAALEYESAGRLERSSTDPLGPLESSSRDLPLSDTH